MSAEGSTGYGGSPVTDLSPTERRACRPEGGNGAEAGRLAVEEVRWGRSAAEGAGGVSRGWGGPRVRELGEALRRGCRRLYIAKLMYKPEGWLEPRSRWRVREPLRRGGGHAGV